MCGSKPGADCGKSRDAKLVLTPERMLEIEQVMNRFGSANCWTGTSGTLAAIIFELVTEVKRLQDARDDTHTADRKPPQQTTNAASRSS